MLKPVRLAVLLSLAIAAPINGAEKAIPKRPIISKGMKLTEALRILRSEGIQAEKLEAVSKPPHDDHEAGELNKSVK